jgi:hypothetical protein
LVAEVGVTVEIATTIAIIVERTVAVSFLMGIPISSKEFPTGQNFCLHLQDILHHLVLHQIAIALPRLQKM